MPSADEILLNVIYRDGPMCVCDFEMLYLVANTISFPTLASGGAVCHNYLSDAVSIGLAALAAASIFHLKTSSLPRRDGRTRHSGLKCRNVTLINNNARLDV